MRTKILLSIGLAVLAVNCDRKAEGQTVAVVNGEEITSAELNAELSSANIPESANKEEARSRVLQTMIDRRLLAQHAREEGLDKSPEFLNRERRAREDLLINMLASRQIETAQLPSASEISRYQSSRPNMFANREQWTLSQLRFAMPKDEKVRQQITATKTLDQLASVLSANGIQFQRAQNKLDTAIIPPELYGQLASLPAGEPFIIPVGDAAVASTIVAREPAALQGEQARPAAVASLRREQGVKVMQDRLKSLRQSAEIDYKEGFSPEKPAKAGDKAPAAAK